MYRVTRATNAVAKPAVPVGEGAGGYFTGGDPAGGIPATQPGYEWFNRVQEELANAIEGAGLILDPEDDTQLHAAIMALIQANIPDTSALLRKQLLMNSLLDAMLGGTALRTLGSVADPYVDTSLINTGASSGYIHDATGAYVTNMGNLVADASSAAQHIDSGGWTTTANGYDDSPATAMSVITPVAGQWFGQDFGDAVRIGRIRVYQDSGTLGDYADAVAIDYSNDGAAWTEAATFTGLSGLVWLDLDVPVSVGSHRYWRVRSVTVHTPNNGYWQISEAEFLPRGPASDLVLVSNSFASLAEPTTGYLLGIVEAVDAITLNVDLLADLSKDGGTTWEAATLEKIGVTAEGYDVLFGSVTFAVSGSQNIASRWRSFNAKELKLHGTIPDAEV